jgi:transposase-like protein
MKRKMAKIIIEDGGPTVVCPYCKSKNHGLNLYEYLRKDQAMSCLKCKKVFKLEYLKK